MCLLNTCSALTARQPSVPVHWQQATVTEHRVRRKLRHHGKTQHFCSEKRQKKSSCSIKQVWICTERALITVFTVIWGLRTAITSRSRIQFHIEISKNNFALHDLRFTLMWAAARKGYISKGTLARAVSSATSYSRNTSNSSPSTPRLSTGLMTCNRKRVQCTECQHRCFPKATDLLSLGPSIRTSTVIIWFRNTDHWSGISSFQQNKSWSGRTALTESA